MPKAFDVVEEWKERYKNLWGSARITNPKRVYDYVHKIIGDKFIYLEIEARSDVPWFIVGIIHHMESSGSFKKHLHNGDPLTARTVRVPRNRPLGKPPFTWEDSALDALGMKRQPLVWDIASTLDYLEKYNGLGYRKMYPKHTSAYLWGCTNHETKGKYIADGVFDATAVTKQAGCVAILLGLKELGVKVFQEETINIYEEKILTFKKGANEKVSENFSSSEFDCKCGNKDCTETKISMLLVIFLQSMRMRIGSPIHITSGYRCEKHNAAVGGVKDSQHRLGIAADIVSRTKGAGEVFQIAERAMDEVIGKDHGGLGRYKSFTHVDVRLKRSVWVG